MRPVLMLFVGTRGIRIADLAGPLSADADVVLAISDDHLSRRADTLDEAAGAPGDIIEVLRAPTLSELCVRAVSYPGRVSGVLAFSDDVLVEAATVAAQRGLPGQSPQTLAWFRDKYQQRRRLAAAGLPVPPYYQITDPAQTEQARAAVSLPAVLKPTRGSGSSLVHIIEREEHLAASVRAAFSASGQAGAAVAADTEFILEGFLAGEQRHEVDGFAPYVSVETAAAGGRYRHLAVTDRFPLATPALETGMMLPSGLPKAVRAEATEAADAALRALEFSHGLAHVELMLTADGPVVIEVNARAGGAVPYLLPMAGGPDLVRLAGALALGELPSETPTSGPRFERYAVFVAPQHPVGVEVRRVTGLDDVRELPGVRAVIPLSTEPTRTDHFHNTMIAAILATADDPGSAVEVWRQVQKTVCAEYAP